ncbi:MAG: hypothetical protein NTY12_04465 [Candidatus Falkowbacteria bacterium]|nr:hypothetical protein [Candidatus Falkowbacteria bacterium]
MFNSKKVKIILTSILITLILISILIIINLDRLRIYPVEPAVSPEAQNKFNACLVDVASRYGEQRQLIKHDPKNTYGLDTLLKELDERENKAEIDCYKFISPSL